MNRQNDGRRNMPDYKREQANFFFSGVGIVREMMPEEMEEAFQKRLKAEQTKTA